jgi:PAS domain S-box-containing protein
VGVDMTGTVLGVAPFVVSALISAATAALAFSRRHNVGAARSFAVVPLSHAVWTSLNVAEVLAPSLQAKLVLDAVQWLPGLGVAAGSLWFAYDYAGEPARRGVWWALLALPLPAIAVAVAVPGWVHRGAAIRATSSLPTLEYPFHWLDWLLTVYGLGLIFAACALVCRRLMRGNGAQARQTLCVLVGLALPPIATLVALAFGVRLLGQMDPTPVVFGVADLLVAFGLFSTRLFDLAPVARDALVTALSDAIVVCDHAGRVADVNRALSDWLGLPDDLVGRPAAEAFAAWPALAEVCAGTRGRGELELPRAGGTRFVDLAATALHDRRGVEMGRAVMLRDVTDRVRAQRALALGTERALHDSQQRFRAIIDHAFELIGLLDREGRVLVANRTALDFAGIDEVGAAALVGQPIWDTPWWRHSEALRDRLRAAVRAAAEGHFVRFEATHLASKKREPRYFDFSLKAVRGEGGEVVLLIAEGRDVTELRRAEHENAALEERLQQARRLDSVGRLAGGVAHDFNNLLTAILGSVEVARLAAPVDDKVAAALEVIEHAAQSAAQLTRQLLAFGRRQTVIPRVVEAGALIAGVQPLLARILGDRIVLETRTAADTWPILADAGQMEQVLINLTANARDAMPDGGTLTIAAENVVLDSPRTFLDMHAAPAGYVQISIGDTGTGMKEPVLERIFEPFYTTKDLGKGTGLGLAVVYGIVRQSGGYIEASSTPGAGTLFRLLFPRADQPAETALGDVDLSSLDQVHLGGHERILIVEDQPAVRHFLCELLEHLGYTVRAYPDGESALADARAIEPPALLVADIVLPGRNGLDLADELRRRWPALKILLVSGYSDEILARYEIPCEVGFMAKPFRAAAFAEKVRAVLDTLNPRSAGEPFAEAHPDRMV